jgi:hypothetical protein
MNHSPSNRVSAGVHLNHIIGEDVSLDDRLEEFWKSKPMSVEDRKALTLIDNSMSKQEGHYQFLMARL